MSAAYALENLMNTAIFDAQWYRLFVSGNAVLLVIHWLARKSQKRHLPAHSRLKRKQTVRELAVPC
jgi:hypothetical protein